MIYLCDLSMRTPKEKITKVQHQKIVSSAVLKDGYILAISSEDSAINIFEVVYKKSSVGDQKPVAFKIERARIIKNKAVVR